MSARSFDIYFINETEFTLVRLDAGHLCHGEWSTEPPQTIAPHSSAHWRSQSGGDIPLIGSIATGTEGWVRYRSTVPNSEYKGDIVYVYWDNPFHGTTHARVAVGDVPADCDNEAVHGPATFGQISVGDVEFVTPEPSVLSQYGFTGDWSSFAVTWIETWPVAIFTLGGIEPHAKTIVELRRKVAAQQQSLMPEIVPIPQGRIAPVVGADAEAWVADWTATPDGFSSPLVRAKIRHDLRRGLAIDVHDGSGYRPSSIVLSEAMPETGFTYPYHDDVVTAPPHLALRRPATGGSVHPVAHPIGGAHADADQAVMVRPPARQAEKRARSRANAVDRIRLSDHAAIELYGEFGTGPAPLRYFLRYSRWAVDGTTQLDLLLRGVKPIR